MRKTRNVDEQNRILKTAFRLFRDKGYSNTTYQDIADKANIQKSKVQYYFPKKEIFLNFFIKQSLDAISEMFIIDENDDGNIIKNLYSIGYFQFMFLLNNTQMEHLKYDILVGRENTIIATSIAANWAFEYMQIDNIELINKMSDAITFSVGGAVEYVLKCLMDSRPFDPKFVSKQVIIIMSTMIGLPIRTDIVDTIDEQWLKDNISNLNKIMFEE